MHPRHAARCNICGCCHTAPHLCAHGLALEEWAQGEREAREVEVKPRATPAAGAGAGLLAAAAGGPAEAAHGPAACERLLLLLLLLGQLLCELLLPGANCASSLD